MTQNTLARTVAWFQKAVPNPTSKNFHTQLGVHFEEVNEMVIALSTDDFETQILIDGAKMALHALATHLKASDNVVHIENEDEEEYLDALCDQTVTAAGCAHMCGYRFVDAMDEVNDSNFSKFDAFEDPIFDPNMKVIKGPDYRKADLKPFV